MELDDTTLSLSRELSELDTAVIEFTHLLDQVDIEYVIVSGYVAILTGRSRGTEDVDVIIERLSEAETHELAETFRERGYWGMSMPLEQMYSMLAGGDRIRIAEEDVVFPNFEIWYVSNDIEREALENAITAKLGGTHVSISSIELQIAYKLRLAADIGTTEGKDFEDALHLYVTFEEQLKGEALEGYVRQFGVEDYVDELRAA